MSEASTTCAVCALPAVFFVPPDTQGRTWFCGEHFYTVYKVETIPTARRVTTPQAPT